jgi:hypothetical protein
MAILLLGVAILALASIGAIEPLLAVVGMTLRAAARAVIKPPSILSRLFERAA